MVVLKNVLVAIDFDEPSEVALTYGRELARTFGAALHVLHVAPDLTRNFGSWAGGVPELGGFQAEVDDTARRRLDSMLSDDDRKALHAQTAVVTSMRTARAIVEYARDTHADVLIVGTHGRGAMAHFVIGSVAERVVRSAPCPVLIVRHPEREFVQSDALQAAASTENTLAPREPPARNAPSASFAASSG